MTDTSTPLHQQVKLLKEERDELAASSTELEADIWYCNKVRELNEQTFNYESVKNV